MCVDVQAEVSVADALVAHAGERASLSTESAEVVAGGLLSAMAGEMASLQAGSGGVHVETTGGASLRTRSVSVQLEETGDATLASRGTLDVSARDLRAGGRSVKVSAKGPATEGATVRRHVITSRPASLVALLYLVPFVILCARMCGAC